MSEFYTNLRDNTAAPLVARFGVDMTYHSLTGSYDVATGVNARTSTDVASKAVRLPVRAKGGGHTEFSEDQLKRFDQILLVSAKELSTASIVPTVEDTVTLASKTMVVKGIAEIAPGGVAVVYKMGVVNA